MRFCVLFSTLSLCLTAPFVYGQTSKSAVPATLGLDFGLNAYNRPDHPFLSQENTYAGVAINYMHGSGSSLQWSVMSSASFIDSIRKNNGFKNRKLLLETNVNAVWMLTPSESNVQPFLLAGLGGAWVGSRIQGYIPVGGGLKCKITQDIFGMVNTQYRLSVFSPLRSHSFLSIGISGAISHRRQRKENKPIRENNVYVKPQVKSTSDRDRDGIPDEEDACPDTPGFSRYEGCPDTTNHSLIFKTIASHSRQEVERILNAEAFSIHFPVDSYTLLPESSDCLRRIAAVLRRNSFDVHIEGHTDSDGSSESNLVLSQHRAEAVRNFLITAGISGNRLLAKGFGESIPLTTNADERGRAENRRVAFRVTVR